MISPDQDKRFKRRFLLFIAVFAFAAFFVLARYFAVMINPPGTELFSPAQELAERGSILDRNGRVLALQTRLGNVSVWRPDITDMDALVEELSPILEMGETDIRYRIQESTSDFLYLKKQAEQSVLQKIRSARSMNRLKGISIEPVMGRIYPEKELAAQIIGFTGSGNTGLGGLEYSFDAELSPRDGKNGSQVILTIDANVQHILENIAAQTLADNLAEAVMLIAADPRTGDILGAAGAPGFDPNNIGDSNEAERMDRTSIWAYEPGSVFKVFSIAAMLEAGAISENSVFTCPGYYERVTSRGERIVINCQGVHGNVNARDIIAYSCNAGAAYASDRIYAAPFREAVAAFGFGARTGAGTPGETAGFFRNLSLWSDRSKPTIAIGQEIAVSALQVVQAATAVANDGILVPPRLVSRVVSDDGQVSREYRSGQARRVLRPETARAMREYMMEGTLGLGIGRNARIGDIALAVKTGTAQIIDPETRAYSDTDFIASCLALLPAEQPSLIVYLVIVKPRGNYYFGARIAAPAIRETAEQLIDYLGIPRGRNPQVAHPGSIAIPADEDLRIGERIPDFTGFSKRSLVPLLLRDDLVLDIRGEGWVRHQIPPPGTPFTPGMTILLELE
ncbi:MAG: penicillin-binding protein 2 [Treponema sp.]|jgi:cell division protein FtsI (penicillin-binding protein 3)|nr:penicillin-binding protein 2 [Treponema sp.]